MIIHKLSAVVFAGLLVAATPHPEAGIAASVANGEPRAHAWAVNISGGGSAPHLFQVGDVASDSGSQPNAAAAALMINGQGTGRVAANAAHPDASSSVRDFTDPAAPFCPPPLNAGGQSYGLCDPGGTFSVRGGFAEAHVTSTTSRALAGIGSGTGNGFAFASKNFSFDQQTQVLSQIQALDDTVFTPINSTLIDALAKPLEGAGLTLPHLQGINPAGLIDFLDTGGFTSDAQTSMDTGFDFSQANTAIGDVKILGGFVELHNVTATADSESNSGSDSRTASSKIGGITIAGLDVVADGDGFHLAGNDLVKRAAIQPAFDAMMSGLKQAGITFSVAQVKALGDLREVTAFVMSWVTPSGLIEVSVGHAEASAASVSAPIISPPSIPPFVSPPGITPPAVGGGGGIVPPVIGPGPITPPVTGPVSNFVFRRPGKDVARALHTVYLIFLIAGLIGSLLYPMFIKHARLVRRRPLLV